MPANNSAFIQLIDDELPFRSYFNPQTGEYLRMGLLDETGRDTGVDPFRSSFPHLLDVGIMGHCQHGISGLCSAAGNYCYQGKVFQFALGGRGDPDQHEHFAEILAYSREHGIIPNLTTSGYQLDREKARLISQYCGASAVSWYRNDYTTRAIDLLLEAGAKVNIHYVLSNQSIDEAIDLIENERLPAGINRIIFLLFKPVGQGRREDMIVFDDRTRHFFSLIDTPYGLSKIGFDSCSVPGVLNSTRVVDPDCYDACEAARYSAYITADMTIVPCSFDQQQRWSVSLRTHSIQQAWHSQAFDDFRSYQQQACPQCSKRDLCLGGCPISPDITLCDNKGLRCS
jgi:radical SAM protein with 4Fe4S-binding SPASM domain